MRNKLLTAFVLLGAASIATAQQVTTVAPSPPPAGSLRGVNSVTPAIATISENGYYYNTQKQIRDEDLKSKEVSKEINAPKGSDIYIENSQRGIVIKTWDQQKVKVTTTVYYEGESKLTDEEWLDKINLSLKTLGTSVKIKSGSVGSSGGGIVYYGSGSYSSSQGGNGVAVFSANGQNIGTKANVKRIVTVTVPAGSKLDIESKYADVTLPANIGDVNVDIANGNLEGDNLGKFILRSKYSNINVGDVKSAEVEMSNGRFSAKNIDDLDIESKYSTVEMAAARKLVLRSTNDEYELEEAGDIRGRKSYGNLRVTKLNGSLELDGSNADVKIRNVGPSLSLIKLDDKYADVRIPLRNTKNYAVDFTGAYSSVYGNFEKVPVTADKEKEKTGSEAPVAGSLRSSSATIVSGNVVRSYGSSWSEGNGPSRFTATVGDGKGLKVDMKCQNCTVDFK